MKRFLMGAAVAVGILTVGGVAHAQDQVIQEADKVVYRQKTLVDFNDVTLEGELTKPEGGYGMVRKRTSFSSLIQMRDNFLPELQKSVDNL